MRAGGANSCIDITADVITIENRKMCERKQKTTAILMYQDMVASVIYISVDAKDTPSMHSSKRNATTLRSNYK